MIKVGCFDKFNALLQGRKHMWEQCVKLHTNSCESSSFPQIKNAYFVVLYNKYGVFEVGFNRFLRPSS